jgi:predicted acylesterase/phospholipase RssA
MTSFIDQIRDRRVGVALSSGFFGFFHQAGVLAALVDHGVRPARLAGNSAGALVGAMYASGLEPDAVIARLLAVKRRDFWDAGWPLTKRGFGLLAGEKLGAHLAGVLPVHGFADCRTPFAAGVYGVDDGRVRHLDSGSLIAAVRASCAVPYLFQPVELDGHRYWDGGFAEKTPLAPFIHANDVDVVIVSHLPPRDAGDEKKRGLAALAPKMRSLFADIPADERLERDRDGVRLLREKGVRVLVLGPSPVKLGPFSLDRGRTAFETGRDGAARILESRDEALLGTEWLS